MNTLLSEKYVYTIFEPLDQVISYLKSITKTSWYDIEVNLTGKVNEDNTFELYPKLSFAFGVFNLSPYTAIIIGSLEKQGNEGTTICAEIRPSYIVLLALYLILILLVVKLVNLFIFNGNDWPGTLVLCIILVFMRGLIHFSIRRLKTRFERIMSVKPE